MDKMLKINIVTAIIIAICLIPVFSEDPTITPLERMFFLLIALGALINRTLYAIKHAEKTEKMVSQTLYHPVEFLRKTSVIISIQANRECFIKYRGKSGKWSFVPLDENTVIYVPLYLIEDVVEKIAKKPEAPEIELEEEEEREVKKKRRFLRRKKKVKEEKKKAIPVIPALPAVSISVKKIPVPRVQVEGEEIYG